MVWCAVGVGAVLFVLLLLAYGLGLRALFRNYIYDKRWVVSGRGRGDGR